MDIDIKVLDIFLREVPPEEILESIGEGHRQSIYSDSFLAKEWFRRFARGALKGYSEDELDLIYENVVSEVRRGNTAAGRIPGNTQLDFAGFVLYFVKMTSEKMLRLCIQEPRCRIDKVLDWREAYLRLGQDLFVSAYVASADGKACYRRQKFTWPAVVPADYVPLNRLLEQGLAENHQHLFGSSQSFALTWMDLMNFPEDQYRISQIAPYFRKKLTIDRDISRRMTLVEKVRLASFLRVCLYSYVSGECCEEETVWKLHVGLQSTPIMTSLKADISFARNKWGALVPQLDGSHFVLDYALTYEIFEKSADEPYRALGSERAFLYWCFGFLYEGKMNGLLQWALYLYLLLKLQFRSEMIQVNGDIGFENFSVYQKRKTKLIAHFPPYKAELIRMALVAPRLKENVVSLETRISPGGSAKADRKIVMDEIEELRNFAQKTADGKNIPVKGSVFYVFHFHKSKDWNLEKGNQPIEPCRHEVKRKEVRRQAIALAQALCRYADLRGKVRGIDSAANEIGCPPEVFANAFRFLRNFRIVDFQRNYDDFPAVSPVRLSATYHAGEDFLDIASALRTIDEAVNFLELERGDRIGHALGLGVLPSVHYKLKHHRIYLRKQDRLDDIVWLLYRGQELGAVLEPALCSKLRKEAEGLLMEIYQPAFKAGLQSITLTDYRCIMQLRGDAPDCYRTGRFTAPEPLSTPYERFAISTNDDARNYYRENEIYANFITIITIIMR